MKFVLESFRTKRSNGSDEENYGKGRGITSVQLTLLQYYIALLQYCDNL